MVALPKISIITPSFNQGKYLEKTILSVLDQNYPNFEYIIIDGGSTDNSVEIIKKYEKHLKYWVSEPDRGQSHAINKGFMQADGDIFGWLNSDDWYAQGALQAVAETFIENPDADAIVGAGDMLDEDTGTITLVSPFQVTVVALYGAVDRFFAQPSCFFSRRAWTNCGPLDENLHLAMDLDLWLNIAQKYRYAITDKNLSTSLVHSSAKTKFLAAQSLVDACLVIMRHGGIKEGRDRLVAFLNELHDCRGHLAQSHNDALLLNDTVLELQNTIDAIRSALEEQEKANTAICQSLSWKVTGPLRGIVTKLTPVLKLTSTLTRNKHLLTTANLKSFARNTFRHGISSTLKESLRVISLDQCSSDAKSMTLTGARVNLIAEENIPVQDISISVVIPTKNAGSSFWQLLKMLSSQKGIQNVEIIVVDSGSGDSTLEIAKGYNARTIEIPAESFSHSYARNLGAEHATGDFLFFTVQDALLPSTTFFYELFNVHKTNDVIAVSCAEFPRADADLFYRFCCWNHYEFLGVNKSDAILSRPEHENYLTLRKNGQLSDIACFISRQEFMRYKYRFDYAEDLDLGIRLIKDGHKIAFLGSIKMIHSHNRPAFYYFKRGYVDQIFLTKNFPDYPISTIDPAQFPEELLGTFLTFDHIVRDRLAEVATSCDVKTFMEKARVRAKSFTVCDKAIERITSNEYIDDELKQVLAKFHGLKSRCKSNKPAQSMLLLETLDGYQGTIGNYLKNTYGILDAQTIEEYKYCIFKAFALVSGVTIANMYLTNPGPAEELLREIGVDMKAGV